MPKSDAERLAVLIRTADVKAYASYGFCDERPDWDNIAALDAEFFVKVAQALLDMGVKFAEEARRTSGEGDRQYPGPSRAPVGPADRLRKWLERQAKIAEERLLPPAGGGRRVKA